MTINTTANFSMSYQTQLFTVNIGHETFNPPVKMWTQFVYTNIHEGPKQLKVILKNVFVIKALVS